MNLNVSVRAKLTTIILFLPIMLSAVTAGDVMEALAKTYPGRISSPAIRDGEWSVFVNTKLFFWAEGRMLPLEELDKYEEYESYSFRPYRFELPKTPPPLTKEEINRLETWIKKFSAKHRNQDFLVALWGMRNHREAKEKIVYTRFLGKRTNVHPSIVNPLKKIEAEILKKAKTDPSLARWIKELFDVSGYVWRNVAGSSNRSLHSFGIAVDLIPSSYRGKAAYWRWSRLLVKRWWEIPYNKRYQIPSAVVAAFERGGFTYGGKWLLFDQMHFEYRPELLYLADL